MKRTPASWWVIAVGPIVGFIGLMLWLMLAGYDGHCGLLDVGWPCGKLEYIWTSFFSPLVLPVFLIYALGWLLLVALAALIARMYRRGREAT